MRQRRTRVPVLLAIVLCIPSANSAKCAGRDTAPRFSFHEGERLTYRITSHSVLRSGPSAGTCADFDATAVLRTAAVNSDSTAEITLVTSGQGRRSTVGETPTRYDMTLPSPMVLIVKPDGSIARMQDSSGSRITLITTAMCAAGGVSYNAASIVAGSYTMFGLQLPRELPAAGRRWTGHMKEESASFGSSGDTSDVAEALRSAAAAFEKLTAEDVKLTPLAVEYVFAGERKYRARACLVFTLRMRSEQGDDQGGCSDSAGVIDRTYFFDPAKGQLLRLESHMKAWGSDKEDKDTSVVLTRVESAAIESSPDALSASLILQRMAETYASCRSYRDSGIVKIVFIEPGVTRTVERPFTTAFVRPDRFRFEYREKKDGDRESRYIVWCSGKQVRTWWDVTPGIEEPESLSLALGGATGVSGGSAHTIPALLLPEDVGGRRLMDVTDLTRVTDAKLDAVECFRLQGRYADSPMTLWIEKKTFLVRRIDGQSTFEDFRTEDTTTYQPAINGKIPNELLEFSPPKQE